MGRILAVDPGTKRVGIAITDPLKIIASPLRTIGYKNLPHLLTQIIHIVEDKDVETVIIGFPIKENGQEGSIGILSRYLMRHLMGKSIDAVLWDEMYTSRLAEDVIRKIHKKPEHSKHIIDGIAASFILKSYLDSLEK